MRSYRFTGLTDEARLIGTMMEQSNMEEGEATFLVRHNIERCVEVWEGDMLCGYFIILVKDKIRQVHGYKLCLGRTRQALRVAIHLLKEEVGVIYSGHQEANQKVNRLLKILGFKDRSTSNGVTVMERI